MTKKKKKITRKITLTFRDPPPHETCKMKVVGLSWPKKGGAMSVQLKNTTVTLYPAWTGQSFASARMKIVIEGDVSSD